VAGPSRWLAAGAGHPWAGIGERAGLVRAEGSCVGVADRPVVGGWSFRKSAGRERWARSGKERGSLTWGGKEAGVCSGSGRCGKGAPVEWLAVRKGSVPFGERLSVLAGAGRVAGVGAGAEDRQAVGTSAHRMMLQGAGNPQAVGRPNRSSPLEFSGRRLRGLPSCARRAGQRGAGGGADRIAWSASGEGSWRPNLRFEPTGLPSVGLRLKR